MADNSLEGLYARWQQLKDDLRAAGLEQVATVGVDGGSFVIHDPVYLASAAELALEDEYTGSTDRSGITRMSWAMGQRAEEKGLLFQWGDGDYPVYAIRGEGGELAAILIVNGP